jgi:DNA-binding winged helix-turn-helix (wHTH) protein
MLVDTVRFGRFEVDLQRRTISKSGLPLRIAPQPFAVLAALLEAQGEIVTREELRRRLWPDGTFVEYEQAINVAVRRLREALGESNANPIFIETVPGLGYRWIFPLAIAAQAPATAAIITPYSQAPADENSADGPNGSLGGRPLASESETSLVSVANSNPLIAPPPQAMPRRRRRWALRLAVVAAGVAAAAGSVLFSNRTARLVQGPFIFRRATDPPAAPGSKCVTFAGRWRSTSDLSDMRITQSGCVLTGSFARADGAYKHTFTGDSSFGEADLVVERTDLRNCTTEMRVTLYLDMDSDLIYLVNGTAGRCGLTPTYREMRLWKPIAF